MLKLTCIGGPCTGAEFIINGAVTGIGRSRDNDIVLDDPVVSGHHAEITRTGREWRVADTSKNGTSVNGSGIADCPLNNGDTLEIRPYAFTCSMSSDEPDIVISSGKRDASTEMAGPRPGEDRIPVSRKIVYGALAAGLLSMLVYSFIAGNSTGGGADADDGFSFGTAANVPAAVSPPAEHGQRQAVTPGARFAETDALFTLAESLYRDKSEPQNIYRAVLTWRKGFERLAAEKRRPGYVTQHTSMLADAERFIGNEVNRRFRDAKVLIRQRDFGTAAQLLHEIIRIVPDQADPRHQQAARLITKYGR